MTLYEALNVLADCHTRPDDLAGFTYNGVADTMMHGHARHLEAWETVLRELGRLPPVEPPTSPE